MQIKLLENLYLLTPPTPPKKKKKKSCGTFFNLKVTS